MVNLEPNLPRSPGHMRMSLAAAMTLGYAPGLFYRDARLHCINLLLTYPEGCRARCAYCGLSAERPAAGHGRSFIRVQWPSHPLDDIVARISEHRQRVERICISMITRRRAVQDTVTVCARLRSSFDIPVSLLILAAGLFLVEGLQLLHMALDAGAAPHEVFYCPEQFAGVEAPALLERFRRTSAELCSVAPRVMETLAERG